MTRTRTSERGAATKATKRARARARERRGGCARGVRVGLGGGMKTRANGRSKARRDARPAWKLHRRLKRGDARRRSFAFPQFHTPPKKTLCARRLTRGRGALAPLLPRSTLRRSRPFWRRRAWARHRFGRARWSATRRVPLRRLGGSVLRLRRAPPRSARARRRGGARPSCSRMPPSCRSVRSSGADRRGAFAWRSTARAGGVSWSSSSPSARCALWARPARARPRAARRSP
jgi:hypothetical protein